MKKFFSKLSLISLVAVFCGMFAGCEPVMNGKFSVSVAEVGASYVDLTFTGPEVIEAAYLLSTKEQRMENPAVIFQTGVEITVKGGETVRISGGIDHDTQYYLYCVSKVDAQNYSEIVTLSFKTTEFNLDELVTVLDRAYDGYRVRLTIPQSTIDAGNAIRWSQCDIMMYNYMNSDDSFSLLHNGGSVENAALRDTTVVYSEETNWYQVEEDYDGDGERDWDNRYNPISPGEPVVFIAGEFAWMEDSPEWETEYSKFPSGWDPGYYRPVLDESYFAGGKAQSSVGIIDDVDVSREQDAYWTAGGGAFQRKFFTVAEPSLLDGGVTVECVEATPINLSLEFYPDDNVDQYAVGIFNDAMYKELLELLNGREDWLQWAITSYFAAYTFGTRVAEGPVRMDLNTFYYQDAIAEDSDYHVLVTAMGDNAATTQSFQEYVFRTTKKVKDAPKIEVTAVKEETTPYKAVFNVKCTTAAEGNPVTECYYAANYLRDWLLSINSGSTYFGIVAGNKAYSYFTADEVEKINSAEGYNIAIESVDGETTRIAVLGYNDEYTPNDLVGFKFIEECPAVADCTTPYTDPKTYVDEKFYHDLADVWTATALLENAEGTKTFEHQSKITLAADLYDYPADLDEKVYDIYEESDYDKEKVDALWYEFKQLAKEITEERLVNQNRLVGIGWLDMDSFDRLDARTPYELFVATDYVSVDVSSLYNDYGPKWYLETSIDEEGNVVYSIPIDSKLLPPAANWSIPFYIAAMEPDNYVTFIYGDGWTPSFPVTVSEDRNTITIHPIELEGVKYYPNMIGMDNTMMQTILENPVVSEIVLTRGWTEDDKEQSAVRPSGRNVQVKGDFPAVVYKKRTSVEGPAELKVIEGTVVTAEQFKANADRLVERFYNQNR